MDAIEKATYLRLRERGMRPEHALSRARDWARFRRLEAAGLVAVDLERDEIMFDDSYLETWDLTPRQLAHEREKLWKLIEREGVWCVIAKARASTALPWETTCVVGGCVGYEGDEAEAFGVDEALDMFDRLTDVAAEALAERATYALGGA